MKPTPRVTMPKYAIFCAGEPQNVTEHDAGKLKPSVSTPIVVTPPQDDIFGADERRDAIKTT
jgi:hypothetical protein